ncbi:MAG TPA: hypothetical protein DCM86_12805 [Verrucomicrobiales bacterium]|nr:hypothetical protein [Verrucomicrobiales bacterium]
MVLRLGVLLLALVPCSPGADAPRPIPQRFDQEVAHRHGVTNGLPADSIQLVEIGADGIPRCFAGGRWGFWQAGAWSLPEDHLCREAGEFLVPAAGGGAPTRVSVPWAGVLQVIRRGGDSWVVTGREVERVDGGRTTPLGWAGRHPVAQAALAPEGGIHLATQGGLFRQGPAGGAWERIEVVDPAGRDWASRDVRGVVFDSGGQLWVLCRAGAACRTSAGWRFHEGRDGLPYNDFTWAAAGPGGEVWMSTHLGVIRFDGREWHYRQGPRWLPSDDVRQVAVTGRGAAWVATAAGLGVIDRQAMTLAEKAALYESEIERYVKRTPYGYVSEARLRKVADRASADPDDSDNDGLWTSMYGAGECFAYAATKDPGAKRRAQQAFEALRFLQKVTQGGPHAPPKGFIARSIRRVDLPDPNAGGLESDRRSQAHDRLWKVYEPRWPKSADGKWYWKSDTSSDELDGHFFFYGLYHEFCAETDAERERVREVVRDITDHLLTHDLTLVDHDGTPTRWGVYGPQFLNRSPNWWPERGLNSLSILAYLTVAEAVTGERRYGDAVRDLVEKHGYAHNAMYPKLAHGPGSGNQSDDEMAFMDYYALLRYSKDPILRGMILYSCFNYWADEAPEMNPLFNFILAAHSLGQTASNPFGRFDVSPWAGWREDSMATLYGFPLDRLDWPQRNSHRIDIQPLGRVGVRDLYQAERTPRGHRPNGKVIEVENRHFNHWNTDPWDLDYPGAGQMLGSGTVFLLPYYLGMYHGFVEKP